MWECAKCGKRMYKNSGMHRMIRTKDGNLRSVGLCPSCAANQDTYQSNQSTWKAVLLVCAIAAGAGLVVFFFMWK